MLYHYERKWGTTTKFDDDFVTWLLYHYERKWGTTTDRQPNIVLYGYTTTRENGELRLKNLEAILPPIISAFSACVNPPSGEKRF